MFNNYSLNDEEILKILIDYNPLILDYSIVNNKLDEDLCQEIKMNIFIKLSKNRKKS